SENAKGNVAARKLFLPVSIVLDGIAVNRFIFTAVDSEVGLAVAIQIQLAKSDAARDSLLEDASDYRRVVPLGFARESHVDGDELHARRLCCAGVSSQANAWQKNWMLDLPQRYRRR